MTKKIIVGLLVVFFGVFLLVGCGGDVDSEEGLTPGEDENIEEVYPERIVSLFPSNTEILFALGLGDKVVGVTEWCNYPEEALEKEKVGDAFDVNLEKIISLEPDLVLGGAGEVMEEAVNFLNENNIEAAIVKSASVAETMDAILYIGEITGTLEEAKAIVKEMESSISKFKEKTDAISEEEKLTVFVLIDPEYLFTVGSNEYLNELVELAGGINIAAEFDSGYFMISEEKVVEKDPDIILSTFPVLEAIQARDAWKDLRAVKEENVVVVDGDIVSRQSPRLTQGLEELYNAFYE